MHVPIGRGVRRPDKIIPVDGGEAAAPLLRVDPFVLDTQFTAYGDEFLVIRLLLRGLREDIVAQLCEPAVEPQLLTELEVQRARVPAQ